MGMIFHVNDFQLTDIWLDLGLVGYVRSLCDKRFSGRDGLVQPVDQALDLRLQRCDYVPLSRRVRNLQGNEEASAFLEQARLAWLV